MLQTRRVVRSQMRMQADLDAMLRAVLRLKMASNNQVCRRLCPPPSTLHADAERHMYTLQYTEADFAALLGAVPTMPARSYVPLM